ncbi:MAG: methylated-DNA--[protein]-cysteine S-methyltransferase [Pseudomonadota bacterium]|nr:methylated-DNA--[protein]-cysteine S-methyltransferase [Pseudomonadota bacterium]
MQNESASYRRIERVISHIDRNGERQPGLDELARIAGLSVFHFSREFRRWAGLSPARYLRTVALSAAKRELDHRGSVLTAAWAAGLSGGGRLHDLFVNFESVTPGEYKAGGEGMRLSHGFATSPFGLIHAALSPRGLVHLAFVDGSESGAATGLARRWPRAALERDDAAAQSLARQIFVARRGRITLAPAGTNFQVRVWEALLELGAKGPTSYSALAAAIGSPGASRAVGQAVGANPVAWLIPCHRVLRRDGELGGYRWGVERKRAMLAWEYAASVSA